MLKNKCSFFKIKFFYTKKPARAGFYKVIKNIYFKILYQIQARTFFDHHRSIQQ
jgi:hypothetical protein